MRKNVARVLMAWKEGKAFGSGSVWTDGGTIYSYATAIATDHSPYEVVVNTTRYSVTSGSHRNGVMQGLREMGRVIHEVNGLPIGVTGGQLAEAYVVEVMAGGR